mgnify:CR=1 FL=1|jgi:ABC-type uncharacterized transport system substrate-binding protein
MITEQSSIIKSVIIFGLVIMGALFLISCSGSQAKQEQRIAVLISGDIRMDPINGMKDGLADLGYIESENNTIEIYNVDGDREQLPILAGQIVDSRPDLPVENPETIEFVANNEIIAQLGLTIPDSIWSLVDEVVEIEIN